MKQRILKLRSAGKTYAEISNELGCSKSLISFHCNDSVRKRAAEYQQNKRTGKEFARLKSKLPPKTCDNCGCDIKPKATNRFCSIRCQHDLQFKTMYREWINDVFIGRLGKSFLKRAVAYRDGYKCSVCGIKDWNQKPITFEVEHINGNSEDNSPDNLCLICPNCHSQTDTYKGKNKGSGRYARTIRRTMGKSF